MLRRVCLYVLPLIILFTTNALAQFGFEYNDSIVVKVGIDTLENPWAGGLNYAQISDFDYDFDGDLDLFVFDRSKDNIRVFSQEDNGQKYYQLVYGAELNFPSDTRYRAALVDFDADGRKDLFTYGIGGVKVYRNVGDAVNGLQWELFKNLLFSEYPVTGTSNLNVSSSDIPAIIDIDGDGDIDILTFHQGGRHVEYHQNQSIDNYGIPDSLEFIVKNQCWGKFSENVNTNSIVLNDPNAPCVGGDIANPEFTGDLQKSGTHAGSTLLAMDYDNSGVMDLIIGDVAYTNLNLLINGGTAVNTDSPMISVDNAFPSNTTPVDLTLFPAGFYVDVDFDNVKDLLVGANAKNVSQNENSILFYKNTGTNSNPNFVYVQDDFLQHEMIEHGTGSIPVFVDYNEDGLRDMMVANFHRYKPVLSKESTIAYYQNTGTANEPVYAFVDEDIFNLSAENYGLRSVPTFGDIDDDGDEDLFIGIENGTLVYHENISTGSGAVYASGVNNYTDNLGGTISAGGFCHPQLFDLDNDGLLDLLLGARAGEILYYRNIGTSTVPSFELTNPMVGQVDVSTSVPDGYAAPHFFRINGETHLFTGSVDGKLIYYNDIDGNLGVSDTFNLESTAYLGIDVQGFSSFWVEDVDDDTNLNLFVGQDLGGLYHFEANPNSDASINNLSLNASVAVYPNPTTTELTISVNEGLADRYAIFDMNGRVMVDGMMHTNVITLSTAHLQNGFYIVQVILEDGRSCSKKVIKR